MKAMLWIGGMAVCNVSRHICCKEASQISLKKSAYWHQEGGRGVGGGGGWEEVGWWGRA